MASPLCSAIKDSSGSTKSPTRGVDTGRQTRGGGPRAGIRGPGETILEGILTGMLIAGGTTSPGKILIG
jgi:hypothetical protein